MAATKLLMRAGVEDREFMEKHAEGAGDYEAILNRYTEPELADLAGVSSADIAYLADTLVNQKPTAILLGWGLHRHVSAHHSIRAVDALGAVSGNIGKPGGGVSQGFEEYGPYDPTYWGDHLNPPRRTLLMPVIGEEILQARNPDIRMIFVTAANPVCSAPNSRKVAEAFRKAEFVVYSGHFLDDTADHANVFLPATTFLEEEDVAASYGHNYVGPVNRAIAPVGESKSDFRIFFELASRFSFADRFRRGEAEWLRDLCAPIREQGCAMAALQKGPFRLDAPMVSYADRVFPIKSGKFGFMREFDPADIAPVDPAFPYKLLTIAPHSHICSERTLPEHPPLPTVTLNPEEASRCGVTDGVSVLVVSPIGEIQAILRTDPEMRRDILAAERGGWIKAGHGFNRLTRDLSSKVGRGTPYYETAVAVRPLTAAFTH